MKRDHLDDAIDTVAARMTAIAQDDGNPLTVERIVAALPQRRPLFWILQGWAPGFAAAVLAVTTGLIVLRPFNDGSTEVLRTENASSPIVELARTITAEAPGTPIVGRLQNRRSAIVEPTVERSENDRCSRLRPQPSRARGRGSVDV